MVLFGSPILEIFPLDSIMILLANSKWGRGGGRRQVNKEKTQCFTKSLKSLCQGFLIFNRLATPLALPSPKMPTTQTWHRHVVARTLYRPQSSPFLSFVRPITLQEFFLHYLNPLASTGQLHSALTQPDCKRLHSNMGAKTEQVQAAFHAKR